MLNPNAPRTSDKNKKIEFDFNGGKLSSDAGLLLIKQADLDRQITERLSRIFIDPRNQDFITHQQKDLIAQRIYGIIQGYEDVNDHQDLRHDPAFLAAIKNHTDQEQPLGSPSTVTRLENRVQSDEISEATKLLVEFFIESFKTSPKQITIDVDATDDPIHGNQDGRYFNAFYDAYCFLPLYFFCGDQMLWAQLRPSSRGGSHGCLAIFHFLVTRIKQEWPDVEIILRGDSGVYNAKLLNYCDRFGYKYIIGYSSNAVLKRMSEPIVFASEMFFVDGGSKEPFRLFWEHTYQARTWDHARQIIVKAERLPDGDNLIGKENTRYIVTNMLGTPQYLYEEVYCARGDMENRIKEQQQMLFADRTSCHGFQANRFRLLLSSFAYVLMETFRRTVLCGTEMAKAQCSTIRVKLFKVAVIVKESVRRILFSLPSHYAYRDLWLQAASRLAAMRSSPLR